MRFIEFRNLPKVAEALKNQRKFEAVGTAEIIEEGIVASDSDLYAEDLTTSGWVSLLIKLEGFDEPFELSLFAFAFPFGVVAWKGVEYLPGILSNWKEKNVIFFQNYSKNYSQERNVEAEISFPREENVKKGTVKFSINLDTPTSVWLRKKE